MAVIEVRDYHYEPDRMEAYRVWAEEAGVFLRDRWDMSGFWLDSGEPARISGSDPMSPRHGSANVTWVLHWDDMAEREAAWEICGRTRCGKKSGRGTPASMATSSSP